MKRLLVVIVMLTAAVLCAVRASAQINPGVIGGLTFSSANLKEFNRETMTQYHVGATVRFKLPMGFSIQPSLIYQVKGAKTEVLTIDSDIKVGYLELPVSFQWGPDLLLFRPFVDVSPFVGYGLNTSNWSEFTGEVKNAWDYKNRWEYGIGLGGGLEIWKLQVVARYNWDFAPFVKPEAFGQLAQAVKESMKFGGVTLSLALLF
jgi:opacity protein-like surface antigen